MDRRKWAVKLDDDVIVNFTNTTFPMSTFTVIVFLTASSAFSGLRRLKYSIIKKITYGKEKGGTLTSLINGHVRLLTFRKNSSLLAVFNAYPYIKF